MFYRCYRYIGSFLFWIEVGIVEVEFSIYFGIGFEIFLFVRRFLFMVSEV